MKNGRTNWGAIAGVAIAIVLTLAFLGWIEMNNGCPEDTTLDSVSGMCMGPEVDWMPIQPTQPPDYGIVDYITNGAVFLGSMVGA